MLNISGIHEGFVLDHIKAGMSLQIYRDLKLDKLDCTVAIIKECKEQQDGQEGYHQGRVSDRVVRPRYPWIYRSQYHCKCDKG